MMTDDAYISFRYARNFAEGYGLVWNVNDPPVEGYTNFLWVVVLAAFYRLGFDLELMSLILGILAGAGTIILLSKTWPEEESDRQSNLLAALLLALSGPFACWATSGLETSLFTFLIFAAFYARLQNRRQLSSILLFLAALTRPEGVLVFGILFLEMLHRRRQKQVESRDLIRFAVPFVLLFSGYFLWRYHYFGYLLPNTFYTKVGGTIWQVWRGLKYTLGFWGVTLLPLLVFVRIMHRRLSTTEITVVAVIGVYTLYTILVGGDYMAMFRFFVPLLPWIALPTAAAIRRVLQTFPADGIPRTALTLLALAAYLLPSVSLERARNYIPAPQIYWNIRYDSYPRMLFERLQVNRLSAIGHWLNQNVAHGSTLACQGIGAIGYFAMHLEILDINGLTDVNIAHKQIAGMGKGLAGHEKEDFLYTLSRKPDIILASRYLRKRSENETFEKIYQGKLNLHTAEERELIFKKLHAEYEIEYHFLEDKANAESGYLILLKRIQ